MAEFGAGGGGVHLPERRERVIEGEAPPLCIGQAMLRQHLDALLQAVRLVVHAAGGEMAPKCHRAGAAAESATRSALFGVADETLA